jgi:hypothetical protein
MRFSYDNIYDLMRADQIATSSHRTIERRERGVAPGSGRQQHRPSSAH